jgi:hypothetical protein
LELSLTRVALSGTTRGYPDGFEDFLAFLCKKYNVNPGRVFLDYDSNPAPPIRGGRVGYYDGLLSFRERQGKMEFLITVYTIARDPLLTLGHEFAHLVDDLRHGSAEKSLRPPDDAREKKFDDQAIGDLAEFHAKLGHAT